MDAGSPGRESVSKDVIRFDALKKLSSEISQDNCHVLEDVSLDELGKHVSEFLRSQDHQKLASKSILCQPSDNTGNCNVEKDDEYVDTDQKDDAYVDTDQIESTIASEKCLSKCATFPFSAKKESLAMSTDGDSGITTSVSNQNGYESVKSAYHRSLSLPSPLKLVSAMKGSREKQETPPKKLTVTWAPDVYDPPPSSSTTYVRLKKQSKKKYDKKNGKNKQKGRTSKGSGSSSRDKKQVQKYGSSSNKCYLSLNDNDRSLNCPKPFAELGDFDVGSPDHCGSSFLKKSTTKLHFSVAEAT